MRPRQLDAEPTILKMLAPASVSVATTPTDVLGANEQRSFLFLRNMSATVTIWFAFDGNIPVIEKGIPLEAKEALIMDRGGVSLGPVRAIASATALLVIQEGE